MTPEQWKEFDPYFTPNECGEGMSYSFMEKFLLFRLDVNLPVIVHSGCEPDGHASMAYHPRGEAIDFHIPGMSMREALRLLDKHGFGGVGAYHWWSSPGFHADFRPISRYQRWVSLKKGEYIYLIQ